MSDNRNLGNQRRAPKNTRREQSENPQGFLIEAMAYGGSNAIERQEAQGQRELVQSEVLPSDCSASDRSALESAGVVFGEPVPGDDLFVYVTLPAGWKKVRTNHSMWSDLVDEHGRKRGAIGYKAAFYDLWANLMATRRFAAGVDYSDEYYPKNHEDYPRWSVVKDGELVIQRFGPFTEVDGLASFNDRRAENAAFDWLNEHYPDWQNASAYWAELPS